MPLQATIDIGTNSVLLLIAKKTGDAWKPLLDTARVTRLGENLSLTGEFCEQAMQRTLDVLKEYKSLCADHQVETITAVGTAAFRQASNAQGFVIYVKNLLQINIAIISGEEEARLSFLSVEKDFIHLGKNIMALDIGGGSTEIVTRMEGHLKALSLPMGVVTLLEKYLKEDPPTSQEIQAMRQGTIDPLSGLTKLLNDNNSLKDKERPLIGLAGTVTTLACVAQKLATWDPAKVQGYSLNLATLKKLETLFLTKHLTDRKKLPGMDPGRADTIVPGVILLQEIMSLLKVDQVIASDRGLRWGVLYDT
jgi:exopolyphosphatase / guanosine-5'-triphosphate,3'-diphosphate pyrophosphatase